MKVEVDVLDSPPLIIRTVSVDRTLSKTESELQLSSELRSCVKVKVALHVDFHTASEL